MNKIDEKTSISLSIFIFVYVISKIYDNSASFIIFSRLPHFNIHYLCDYLIVITGIISLVKPGSTFRASFFLSIVIINFFNKLPLSSNHEFFAFFVNITFISCFIYLYVKHKGRVDKIEFSNLIIPVLRVETYVLYFWATVNKMNYDFFNPIISCSTAQIFSLNQKIQLLPENDFFISLNTYLTVIIEGGIPLLLIFRKTRIVGIIVALIFHFIIGFGHYRFSIMVFALLTLFIPQSNYSFIINQFQSLKSYFNSYIIHSSKFRQIYHSKKFRLLCQIILIVFTLGIINFIFGGGNKYSYRIVLFMIISLSLLYIVTCVSVLNYHYSTHSLLSDYKLKNKMLLIFPLIIFIYGSFPHIGLKNIQVMAMYSNLRTEGGTSNHFFIPASLQLFNNLKELVEIESSSIRWVDEFSSPLGSSPHPGTHIHIPYNYA